MSLNVTINGFCYLDNVGLSGNTVKYQALWYPNGTASSPTKWNAVRVTESTSYWNCNLGDLDWLSQDGSALTGGKIVIVFWKGATLDRNDNCIVLEEWGTTEITHDGSSTYSFNIQIKKNICPILNWSFPTEGVVNTSYTAINNSYDVHTWDFNGVTMAHRRTKYGENIQLINTVNNSDYYWGDGDQDVDVPGTGNRSHTWTVANDYDVTLVVEDECGCTVTGTKPIRIYWRSPTCGIECNEASGQIITSPDTVVTFNYDGVDVDGDITSVDWYIHDSGSYGNTDTTINDVPPSATVSHTNGLGTDWSGHSATSGAFTNPGSHLVELWIHWNDGFDDHTLHCSDTFTQNYFSGPAVSFTQDPIEAEVFLPVIFENTSTDSEGRVGTGLPDGTKYSWEYKDNGVTASGVDDVEHSYDFTIVPDVAISGTMTLCAEWSDGWDTHELCETEYIRFKAIIFPTPEECFYNLHIEGTSTDGSVSGYSWEILQADPVTSSGGPWELAWTSPVGMDQQDKEVFFTEQGYYKVLGYVYGTGDTTYDDEIIYVGEPCVGSGISGECFEIIWNGTGPLDHGGDWEHRLSGDEVDYARHTGTNGLHVYEYSSNVEFKSAYMVEIDNYTMLDFWIKPLLWREGKEVEISFGPGGTYVNLSDYVRFDVFDEWQRIVIPLQQFGLLHWNDPSKPTSVNKLLFDSNCEIEYYLDDIQLSIGSGVYIGASVCAPDMSLDPTQKHLRAYPPPNVSNQVMTAEESSLILKPFPPPNLNVRRKYVP